VRRVPLFIKNELHLLRENINALSESYFFNSSITDYLLRCQNLIDDVLSSYDTIPSKLSSHISQIIWQSIKYISGSTSNKIPYEIVYALESALTDWTDEDHIICTALLDDRDFHFNGIDLKKAVVGLVDFNDAPNLIHIAFPKIYRHKYLYGPALYHELGHYIDTLKRVSELSFIVVNDFRGTVVQFGIELSHRKEFFADIFAASYTGESIIRFLNNIAGGEGDSSTHPSTKRRVDVISKFLEGRSSPELDRINNTLKAIKLPVIEKKFTKPEISACFSNVRPYQIKTLGELHGIITSSWDYIDKIESESLEPWASVEIYEAKKAINDLVEKSVRNWIIKEKWANAATD
jgi:hypothetical protein